MYFFFFLRIVIKFPETFLTYYYYLQVDFVVSSQHTLSVSQVQTEEKVKELKPHEIPGSKKLDVTIPSEIATEVSEVLTQGMSVLICSCNFYLFYSMLPLNCTNAFFYDRWRIILFYFSVKQILHF